MADLSVQVVWPAAVAVDVHTAGVAVAVEWPQSVPVEVRSAAPITVTVDAAQGLPGPEGPQGPPGPGSDVQDTGWLDIPSDPDFPGALINIRRWGPWVAFAVQAFAGSDLSGATLCTIPAGFRPALGSFAYGAVLDLNTTAISGTALTRADGATLWLSPASLGAAQYQWLTPDAFPEP